MGKALLSLELAVCNLQAGRNRATLPLERDYLNLLTSFFACIHMCDYSTAATFLKTISTTQGVCFTPYVARILRIVRYCLRDGVGELYEQQTLGQKDFEQVHWLQELDLILTTIECANYDKAKERFDALTQLQPST